MKKTCTRCEHPKPLKAFAKNPRGKYGRRSVCRDCTNKCRRKRYAADPAVAAKSAAECRQYYLTNRDKVAASQREWRETNATQVAVARREWAKANREKVNANNARSRLKLRGEVYELLGGKCSRCPCAIESAMHVHHKDHTGAVDRFLVRSPYTRMLRVLDDPDSYELLCANCHQLEHTGGADVSRYRAAVLVGLGGKCRSCPVTDVRVLHIDHIFGGGAREKIAIGSSGVLREAKKFPTHYQLLCANCNWVKRHELGECKRK